MANVREAAPSRARPSPLRSFFANLALFAGEVLASRSFTSLWEVPRDVGLIFGANFAPLTLGLGQYDRLVASCFLHGGLLHVGLNMWSLGQIGPYAEETVGSARYAVLYVVTGIAASAVSLVWGLAIGHVGPSLGASGAICGVMGAALVLGVRLEGWRSSIARQVGFWLLIIVVYGARTEGIDNAAHVGGMISGTIIATLWRRGIHYSTTANVASIGLSAALCIASFAAVLLRDATDPFAIIGRNERSAETVLALTRHDCAQAKRWLAATVAVAPPTPDLEGLRDQVARECPSATK